MTAGAGASGVRAWLGRHHLGWLTPPRLRRITIGLVAVSLGLSSLISGSTAQTPHPASARAAVHVAR